MIHTWQKKSIFFFFFLGDFIYVFISINQQKHISDFVLFSFYSRKKIAFFSLGFTHDINFLIFNFWTFYLCMYFYRLTEKQIWSGDKLTTRKKEKNLRFFFFLYSWNKYYFFFLLGFTHGKKIQIFYYYYYVFHVIMDLKIDHHKKWSLATQCFSNKPHTIKTIIKTKTSYARKKLHQNKALRSTLTDAYLA